MLKPALKSTPAPEISALQRGSEIAFWTLLILFELFVATLPLFPTGDGGLHLYYAAVLRALISHQPSPYTQFYAMRRLVQPYLLHYYALMAFETVVRQDTAEKIIVMIDLATMALGFRRLVRVLSPRATGLSLMAFPLLLSWPLAMGAVNYTFALGVMFFALAEYARAREHPGVTLRWGRFFGYLVVLVLSHPVPLFLLLCIFAVDLLAAMVEHSIYPIAPTTASIARRVRPDALHVCASDAHRG